MSSILKVDTIQDQAGNNIISEAANVITIGASGDTITVPAGATVSGFTSAGIDDNATSTAITISPSNNIGIGNAGNALRRLDITQTSGLQAGVRVITDGSGAYYQMFGGVAQTKIGSSHNSQDIEFHNGSGEQMRITSAGLVGIGTASPSTSLHISQSQPIITLTDTDTSVSHQLSGQSGSRHLNLKVDTGGSSGSPVFNLSMQDSIKLSVLNNGRVGIGTSNPGATLETIGTAGNNFKYATAGTYFSILPEAANGNVSLRFRANSGSAPDLIFKNDGASEVVRIANSGNVGIGTSSPSTLLHLSSTSPVITFEETDQSNRKFQIGSFGNAYGLYDATNSQYRYIVDNSGNHIFNEGGLDCDFRVESNNNANMLFVDGNGDRVGIGTSNPDAQFQTDVASATIGGGRIYTNAVRTGVNSSALFSVRADNASGSSSGDIVNIQGDGVGDLLTLNNNGTDRVTVQADGKVQFKRPRSNTLGDSALEILPSDTVVGIGFRMENTNNDLVIEKSSPSGSEAEILRIRSGGGIALGGTGDANTLDDYEEGSFTPAFAANSCSFNYSQQFGNYTKVGRVVHCKIFMRGQASGSTSQDLKITGLPFTSSNTNGMFASCTFGQIYIIDLTDAERIVGQVAKNSVKIDLQFTVDNNASGNLIASTIDNSTSSGFILDVTYFTDA